MDVVYAKTDYHIKIGRKGENMAQCVKFDISDWIKSHGSGVVELIVQRHGETAAYPAVVEVNGSEVTWNITAADTAIPGFGLCELRYYVGDVLAKSKMYTTHVLDALGDSGPVPPDPAQGWVDQVVKVGEEVREALTKAPYIGGNGNWIIWNAALQMWGDSGVRAEGRDGEPGRDGQPGRDGEPGKDGAPGRNGLDGRDGTTPNIQIGTVDTLPAGSQATVTRSGSDANPVLNFGIPQGEKGKDGEGGGVGAEKDPVFLASSAAKIKDSDISNWNGKQNAISDLSTIRAGASAGATAVQPEAGKGLFSGNYNDLSNKPTIPTAVTEQTVTSWGFAKESAIPTDAHINGLINTKIGTIETALQSMVDTYGGVLT